jgi:hypothetical protein
MVLDGSQWLFLKLKILPVPFYNIIIRTFRTSATLQRLIGVSYLMNTEDPTLSSGAAHVNRSVPQEGATDSQANQDSCMSTLEQFKAYVLSGLSGKTSQVRSQAKMGTLSDNCSKPWMNAGIMSHGEYWTRSFSEFHSGAGVSYLSDVLQKDVPKRYYLSPRAALGIMSRVKRKGRSLPPQVLAALETMIQGV